MAAAKKRGSKFAEGRPMERSADGKLVKRGVAKKMAVPGRYQRVSPRRPPKGATINQED